MNRNEEYLQNLIRELRKLPTEQEWVEFKRNVEDPEMIAKDISALSNAAALLEKPYGYLIWGIDDNSHNVIGTSFNYRKAKKGNEELEAWLARMINPKIDFHFYEIDYRESIDSNAESVVVVEVPHAESEPTRFKTTAYVRIGSNTKPLVEYKDKEARLWRTFDTTTFEMRIAKENVSSEEITEILNYPRYYEILRLPIPTNREKILKDLSDERFIKRNDSGDWDITNCGALMIARDFKAFETVMKRGVRVISYKGKTRVEGVDEKEFYSGYAISFEDIIQYIITVIPKEEVIENGVRKQCFRFPEIAIRELLANIMVHQSLGQKGTNPMVEIFSNRIEFSNAGAPLVEIERIIDTVPISRNENIAGFMHRCGICEERGSGYDKVVLSTSQNNLLAPRIENQNNQFTKVTMFAKIPFDMTTREERVWTCYMRACLAYVEADSITNSDIRTMFGLGEAEKSKASRIIKDTLTAGYIKPVDPDTAPRYMRYIPSWA